MGVQDVRSGRGRQEVGDEEEQAKDELREALKGTQVALGYLALGQVSGFFSLVRYYYDKKIIQKTAGKRYVYRFVCDLKAVLGCDPESYFALIGISPGGGGGSNDQGEANEK